MPVSATVTVMSPSGSAVLCSKVTVPAIASSVPTRAPRILATAVFVCAAAEASSAKEVSQRSIAEEVSRRDIFAGGELAASTRDGITCSAEFATNFRSTGWPS